MWYDRGELCGGCDACLKFDKWFKYNTVQADRKRLSKLNVVAKREINFNVASYVVNFSRYASST